MANVKDVTNTTTKITLLDNKEHELKYDLNALIELEERYGSIDDAFDAMDKNSIKAIRCVLWAGLLYENPDITEQEVGGLIDLHLMTEMVQTMGKALSNDMPDKSAEVHVANVITASAEVVDPN